MNVTKVIGSSVCLSPIVHPRVVHRVNEWTSSIRSVERFVQLNNSPFNERMPKCQERYHIHLHTSASQVFKKSSFLDIILNLDRRIRNYYKKLCETACSPAYQACTCYNVWKITISLPTMPPYSHYSSTFSCWTVYSSSQGCSSCERMN